MSTNLWQGRRVRLRAVEPADSTVFAEWNLDSDVARRLYSVPFPQSHEATRRWAEKLAAQAPDHDQFFFVIETLGGTFAGSISTHNCDARNGTLEYGLAVRREHQRQGYASEAILLLLRYYFDTLRYQKATAHIYAFNEPSIRLHVRLGYQLEGRLRGMIYVEGAFHDELVYGMTAAELGARHPPETGAGSTER